MRCADVKYFLGKRITTYVPQVFIGVFLHPFLKRGPKGASKPSKLPVLCAGEFWW